jgi:Negative regulator of sigma F
MKTDELVTLLSTNPEPVDRGLVGRTLYVALAAGLIVSLGLALVGLGIRSHLTTAGALIFLVVKLCFAVGIVSLALVYLTRLARPGGERKAPYSADRTGHGGFVPLTELRRLLDHFVCTGGIFSRALLAVLRLISCHAEPAILAQSIGSLLKRGHVGRGRRTKRDVPVTPKGPDSPS